MFLPKFPDSLQIVGKAESTPAEGSEMSIDIMSDNAEEEQQLQEECQELTMHFTQRTLEALLKATRLSLDAIKRRVFFST